jgi:desampylase
MMHCTQLELPADLYAAMVAHATEGSPSEVVGMLGGLWQGQQATAVELLPLESLGSNEFFLANPRSQYLATRTLKRLGHQVVGIYHSHPGGVAVPSPIDCHFARDQHCPHIVIGADSTHAPGAWEVTAWWVGASGRPSPVPIRVTGEIGVASRARGRSTPSRPT